MNLLDVLVRFVQLVIGQEPCYWRWVATDVFGVVAPGIDTDVGERGIVSDRALVVGIKIILVSLRKKTAAVIVVKIEIILASTRKKIAAVVVVEIEIVLTSMRKKIAAVVVIDMITFNF